MTDILTRNWKARLVCLILAFVVWYSMKGGGRVPQPVRPLPLLPSS
jgi:hypothetical protein